MVVVRGEGVAMVVEVEGFGFGDCEVLSMKDVGDAAAWIRLVVRAFVG